MSSEYNLGPQFTQPVVKKLIVTTCILSLLTAFLSPFFYYFNLSSPFEWFALSWQGLHQQFIWQPLTYLLMADSSGGISLSLLFSFTFQMYLLWTMGSDLVNRYGSRSFMFFYLGCGTLTGLATLATMLLTGQYTHLASPAASIIAMMVVWALTNPTAQLFLFFLIPFKAINLIGSILGALLLVSFFQWHLTDFFFYFFAIFIGYLWGLIQWGLSSPFPFTHRFEVLVENFSSKLKSPFSAKKTNIYDIKTGQLKDDDDQFMDEMLSKISKFGRNSLSPKEQARIQRISESKKK